jgi:hypothetical protein
MTALASPLDSYRTAFLAGDVEGMLACMRHDVVLRSPITERFAFHGHEQLRDVLADVHAVTSDHVYLADVGDDRARVLALRGRVGRQQFTEAVLVELDGDGLIATMELFVRPMPALTQTAAVLAPRVARRRGRLRAFLVRLMIAPLNLLATRGEGAVVALGRPLPRDR